MKKKTTSKSDNVHGPLSKVVLSFEVPGESIIALHNALSYTLAHKEEFAAEADDCPTCLRAMEAFRRYLLRVIDHSPVYEIKGKTN